MLQEVTVAKENGTMADSNNQITPPESITNDLYPVIKGGTVIGRKHIVNRINRQDNIAYRTFGDKAVGVVCDGAVVVTFQKWEAILRRITL